MTWGTVSLAIMLFLWGLSYKIAQQARSQGRERLGMVIEWTVVGCFVWFAYEAVQTGDFGLAILFSMFFSIQVAVIALLPR